MKYWFIITYTTFLSCTALTEKEDMPTGEKPDRPGQEGWNSVAVFSSGGVKDAELHFAHMQKWDTKQLTTFRNGLRVEFFEKGTHSATLTSDSGEIRSNTNNLFAYGNVVIVSDSGVSMQTEKIYWDHQKQRIFADGLVTMTTDEDTLRGYQFESNKDLTNWKMKNASGRSARDIDLRTGTVRPKSTRRNDTELDKEMDAMIKERP